ncbi:hypothetical protein [Actinotignum sp. GS-2025c]|uniref:hypothetical protein n=1 Tax=Actinotignum sp. GS-2025c TaxID=3427276 RepID=UPI003F46D5A6
MKKPDTAAMQTLKKAPITNPIVAGGEDNILAGTAGTAGNASSQQTAKITIRLPREDADRIRGAWLADCATGNRISLSEWITTILNARVDTYANITPVVAGAAPKGNI